MKGEIEIAQPIKERYLYAIDSMMKGQYIQIKSFRLKRNALQNMSQGDRIERRKLYTTNYIR